MRVVVVATQVPTAEASKALFLRSPSRLNDIIPLSIQEHVELLENLAKRVNNTNNINNNNNNNNNNNKTTNNNNINKTTNNNNNININNSHHNTKDMIVEGLTCLREALGPLQDEASKQGALSSRVHFFQL
ncbi:unnamed protein product [Polarella glacialis]|uniref:Uncharacterized protein n=1 Tax=Polarella glacialis TaxID=89957 RepID=A0A813FIY6_POLGL|nr:unnamed protein product [Polarella glacialis]